MANLIEVVAEILRDELGPSFTIAINNYNLTYDIELSTLANVWCGDIYLCWMMIDGDVLTLYVSVSGWDKYNDFLLADQSCFQQVSSMIKSIYEQCHNNMT